MSHRKGDFDKAMLKDINKRNFTKSNSPVNLSKEE